MPASRCMQAQEMRQQALHVSSRRVHLVDDEEMSEETAVRMWACLLVMAPIPASQRSIR